MGFGGIEMKFADKRTLVKKSKHNTIVVHVSGGCVQDVYLNGKELPNELFDLEIVDKDE